MEILIGIVLLGVAAFLAFDHYIITRAIKVADEERKVKKVKKKNFIKDVQVALDKSNQKIKKDALKGVKVSKKRVVKKKKKITKKGK